LIKSISRFAVQLSGSLKGQKSCRNDAKQAGGCSL
jgi:hypothetical protein